MEFRPLLSVLLIGVEFMPFLLVSINVLVWNLKLFFFFFFFFRQYYCVGAE